ncbi:MAG: hypothetical protein SPK06_02470 [Kiritimatiellia bacterium]|nr:hypothetical protein [Kiritimatiellia bacterium]
MKKFTVFAFAALVACGAFAQCTPDPDPYVEAAVVYNFKFSGKTTAGYPIKIAGDICQPGSDTTEVIRIPGTIAGAGVIATCDPTCNEALMAPTVAVFWTTKAVKQEVIPSFSWTFLNVIGKKQSDAEAAFVWDDGEFAQTRQTIKAVSFAALGKFDAKKGLYTSFSGNFAGTLSASVYVPKSACDAILESQVWKCDDLETLVDEDTVVYGTWSLKYNSSASKKAAKDLDGTVEKLVPAYVGL